MRVNFGRREEMHLLAKQHSKTLKRCLKIRLINTICTLKHGSLLNIFLSLFFILFLFTEYIFMHVYAQVYEFTQAVLKLFIFFLHSPFRNRDEAEKHSCKNNKAVRSLARQIKSYFQMWNDRQTDPRNLRWPSGTGLRHRGTLLCSETDEYSLFSGGSRPSSFRETLSVPQINTSFGFLRRYFFVCGHGPEKDVRGAWN